MRPLEQQAWHIHWKPPIFHLWLQSAGGPWGQSMWLMPCPRCTCYPGQSAALWQHWGFFLKHLLVQTESLAPGSPDCITNQKGKELEQISVVKIALSFSQLRKEISVIAPHPGFLSKGKLEMFSLPFWISFCFFGIVGPPTEHKLQISKQLYLNSVKSIMQATLFQ